MKDIQCRRQSRTLISRKRRKIKTLLLHDKWYLAYRIAAILMTLHSKPCIGFQSSRAENRIVSPGLSCHQQQGTMAPVYLQNLLTTTASVSGRASNRSASNNDFVKQSLGERAFLVAGPRVWNQLPIDLKAITDARVFRRQLKTFLFSRAHH